MSLNRDCTVLEKQIASFLHCDVAFLMAFGQLNVNISGNIVEFKHFTSLTVQSVIEHVPLEDD